jgi:hypothetical protein
LASVKRPVFKSSIAEGKIQFPKDSCFFRFFIAFDQDVGDDGLFILRKKKMGKGKEKKEEEDSHFLGACNLGV